MILHVDMDAFYASIEQRDDPQLRGKPVVVGGSRSGRGVVAAASYEARRYGIHSAMPGRRAAELCPHAMFVRSRLDHYAAVGRQVRAIFHRFTPVVQPLSLDEAFLDVSGTERLHGNAEAIGRAIKQAVADELRLTASVGIAPRKFVAKIASDLDKPDGLVIVREEELIEFLDPLPVEKLWGVGKVGQHRLHRLGLKTIRDVRRYDRDALVGKLGDWGNHLWRLANAIDTRPVVPDHDAKQISHERTFSADQTDEDLLRAVVCFLVEQTAMRLRRHGRKTRTVTVKYRREDFKTFSQSKSLDSPTDQTRRIIDVALDLLASLRHSQPRPVRLIGVSLGSLVAGDTPTQLTLFDEVGEHEQHRAVDQVVDRLAERFGNQAVYRAGSHNWRHRKRSEE